MRDETKGPTRDLPVVSGRGQVTSPDGIMGGHEYSLSFHSILQHEFTAKQLLIPSAQLFPYVLQQRKAIKSTSEANTTVD